MGLAAKGLGWDYERLLVETLGTAHSLRYLRGVEAQLGEWLKRRILKIGKL
jgi:hypothetical protein